MRSTTANPKANHRATASDDDDPTSSSGSSSSESESEANDSSDEDEDESMQEDQTAALPSSSSIPHIGGRPKPRIHRVKGGSDIMSRLSTFLPKMKDANEDLEKEIAAGRGRDLVFDDVEEGSGRDYIEMNLGLGVLEEKRGDNDDSDSGDEGDVEPVDGKAGPVAESNMKSKDEGDSNVLGKLMGGKQSAADKPSIEEMAE